MVCGGKAGIMYVFISHSSSDAARAQNICELLENGGHQCFIAPRDIRSGKEYAEELILGIERSDIIVLLMSNAANRSPHVLREVEHAASSGIPIMVYKLEEVELTKSMEYFLLTNQWVNQNPEEGIRKILKCVNDMQGEPEKNITRRLDMGSADAPAAPVKKNTQKKRRFQGRLPIAAICIFVVFVAAVIYYINGMHDMQEDAEERIVIQLGSAVTLGTYNGEPVSWQVIHLSEDESQAVLITEQIVTMKAYDAAQSERFNRDAGVDYWKYTDDDFADKAVEAKVRGNNTWDSSCIRTWLNSDEQVVSYEGAVPSGKVMSDMKNGYEHEAGFLCGFTQEEQDAIVTTQVRSKGNVLSKDSAQVTDDKVFLLDMEELEWLREADVSILAKPTEAAVREDETHWYGAYSLDLGTDNYFWWLREPVDGSVSQCHIVSNGVTGEMVTVQTVGVEGFGIRPAVTVDVDALARLTYRSALSR